jgi:hypothetical protein
MMVIIMGHHKVPIRIVMVKSVIVVMTATNVNAKAMIVVMTVVFVVVAMIVVMTMIIVMAVTEVNSKSNLSIRAGGRPKQNCANKHDKPKLLDHFNRLLTSTGARLVA